MKAALHSDIGHAGNKGEDRKLDMTLSNLDSMRRKTEVYMSLQRKSFVAGLEKKQGTWIREHERTASKSNNQAKLRKENRQRAAEEEAKRVREKIEREEKELENEKRGKEGKTSSKIPMRPVLAPRKSMLISADDIYEPVETPPPPKETKSITFRKLARAIGMASVTFGKMAEQGEGIDKEEGEAGNSSAFKKKVSAALGKEETLSFSSLVMKIKEKQKQEKAALATINETDTDEQNRIKEQKARERQRRIAEQQKLPPLLRRGSVVSSILKEADEREEIVDDIMKQEQPILSGPDPILISEVLPKIELDGTKSQPPSQPRRRRKRRSRRRNDLTKSKSETDPLKDERFIKLQHLLKPELKQKDTEIAGLTTSLITAKKYARWWKAGVLNAASKDVT
ncbi:hypothetical protein HOLleu_18923 [Holothuria leucospilota]|uniref:Uncharacterized protein n=1 Tax=Holothuria leucospilota TaxID=206669 RepID=A0A9Q1C2I1_HOLLE|nr:hypothetical protein HOLleu_18923 [Holothuria leucospilota]